MNYGLRADRSRDGQGRFALARFALAILLFTPGFSLAADEPINEPANAPVGPALIPDLPDFIWIWQGPDAPLELLQAQPFGPEDKGGTYTDMGRGGPSRLTERETALLGLSRLAVEASRLAGTLQTATPETRIPASGDAERLKQEAVMRAPYQTPVPGSGAPSDRMVPTIPGRSGSAVPLTRAEIEKLAATEGRSGIVILPAPVVVPDPDAPRPPQGGPVGETLPTPETPPAQGKTSPGTGEPSDSNGEGK